MNTCEYTPSGSYVAVCHRLWGLCVHPASTVTSVCDVGRDMPQDVSYTHSGLVTLLVTNRTDSFSRLVGHGFRGTS